MVTYRVEHGSEEALLDLDKEDMEAAIELGTASVEIMGFAAPRRAN